MRWCGLLGATTIRMQSAQQSRGIFLYNLVESGTVFIPTSISSVIPYNTYIYFKARSFCESTREMYSRMLISRIHTYLSENVACTCN